VTIINSFIETVTATRTHIQHSLHIADVDITKTV